MTGHADSSVPRGFKRFTLPKRFRGGAAEEPKHPVTDHALVRYFERVLGLDVEAIRSGVLTDAQLSQAAALQDVELNLAPGVRAVVRNGRVVTIK